MARWANIENDIKRLIYHLTGFQVRMKDYFTNLFQNIKECLRETHVYKLNIVHECSKLCLNLQNANLNIQINVNVILFKNTYFIEILNVTF